MDIKLCNNEKIIIDKELEINLKKINNSDTTKEEESIFITEENIAYCSSPKSGLVSIKKSMNNDNAIVNIGSQISNITNTVTFTIDMIKKEINCPEIKSDFSKSNTYRIKEIKEKQDNDNDENNLDYMNKKSCCLKDSQNDKEKTDKMKSFFKKKTKKYKDNKINQLASNEETNINNNMNKKTSKVKKKKTRESNDKKEINKNLEHCKSIISIKDKNIKKSRKKTHKTKDILCLEKLLQKKKKLEKEEKKEVEDGKSPKVIILDFSSSNNSEENEEETEKDIIKINKSNEEEKNNDLHNSKNHNNSYLSSSFKKEENEFCKKIFEIDNENHILHSNTNNIKSYIKDNQATKLVTPKSKKGCFVDTKPYKIVHNRSDNNSKNRRLSANYGRACFIKSSLISKVEDIKNIFKKEKRKKENNDCNNIGLIKNKNNNDEYQNGVINSQAIKENIQKTKKKAKIKVNKNNEFFLKKESNKNIHNTLTITKFRHLKTQNYDKKINVQKSNINGNLTASKARESTNLTNATNNNFPKKSIYSSNKNLAKITITTQDVENTVIHLEMNGKQETIFNYTNQEMVDDENEYMVECFKILLKLDKSKQPRCKNKVNFNFEDSPTEKIKTKIALFDLDETLVHCTKEQKGLNGDSVNIKLPTNKVVNVGLNIRPHWKEALDLIKNHYHIVVYTASHQSYADAVLDYIDKENKYFQYRLYRNHCVQCDVDGIKFYVKDLDTLSEKYNLKDVVIIDNSVLSFAYHLNNGIPIVPYIEQKEDSQLLMLAYYLVSIANFDDLIQENKKHINIEHFILEVKNLENEEEEGAHDGGDKIEIKDKDYKKDNDKNETKNREKDNTIDNFPKDDKKCIDLEKKSKDIIKKKNLASKQSKKVLKFVNDIKKNMADAGDVYNKNKKL